MKNLKLIAVIALFSVVLWSCKNETTPETKTVEVEKTMAVNDINPNATLEKSEFNINGMTCAIGCAKTIEKKLSEIDGVKSATVDFDKKLAMVEYDKDKVTQISLEKTVTNASDKYSVTEMKTVESFTTNGAKKGCDKDCKKPCCANKDKKECDKDCKKDCCAGKDKKECKGKDKADCKGKSKADCKGKDKADCKGKSKADCKGKEKAACKEDCKKACCADKDKKA